MYTYKTQVFGTLLFIHQALMVVYPTNTSATTPNIRYEVHHGELSETQIQQLIPPGVELFYDYPYLIVATDADEEAFLRSISKPSVLLVTAYDQDLLIGALLSFAVEDRPKLGIISTHSAHTSGKSLYIAEVMVAKPYQKQGIARQLLMICEEDARTQGYVIAYLMTVMRSKDHPFKTADATDIDAVWSHLGFQPTHLYEPFLWTVRCGTPEHEVHALADNMVQYWYKYL